MHLLHPSADRPLISSNSMRASAPTGRKVLRGTLMIYSCCRLVTCQHENILLFIVIYFIYKQSPSKLTLWITFWCQSCFSPFSILQFYSLVVTIFYSRPVASPGPVACLCTSVFLLLRASLRQSLLGGTLSTISIFQV